MDANILNYAGAAALIGGVVGFWTHIKSFFSSIGGFFIIKVSLETQASNFVIGYLANNFKTVPFGGNYIIAPSYFHIKKENEYKCCPVEKIFRRPSISFYNKFPIFILPKKVSMGESDDHNYSGYQKAHILMIRGTINIDKLIYDSFQYAKNNLLENDRRYISRLSGSIRSMDSRTQNGATPNSNPTTSISDVLNGSCRLIGYKSSDLTNNYSPTTNGYVLSDQAQVAYKNILTWFKSENWYKSKGIPWRFGIQIYGTAGTGKSAFAKFISNELNIPINVFDISTMDNYDFNEKWDQILNDKPCIALIEDIDNIFHKRENILNKDGKHLSFDCLLNRISGVENSDGILLIITTNDISKIDDALGVSVDSKQLISSRPGRLDLALELKALSEESRKQMARRILSDCSAKIDDIIKQGHGDTGAQFQERCTQAALEEYWKNK